MRNCKIPPGTAPWQPVRLDTADPLWLQGQPFSLPRTPPGILWVTEDACLCPVTGCHAGHVPVRVGQPPETTSLTSETPSCPSLAEAGPMLVTFRARNNSPSRWSWTVPRLAWGHVAGPAGGPGLSPSKALQAPGAEGWGLHRAGSTCGYMGGRRPNAIDPWSRDPRPSLMAQCSGGRATEGLSRQALPTLAHVTCC